MVPQYTLRNSFLLDSAATIHVCNNLDRFTSYTSTNRSAVFAGGEQMPIQGYGEVQMVAWGSISLGGSPAHNRLQRSTKPLFRGSQRGVPSSVFRPLASLQSRQR
ncbi:hypothetical protein BDY21DRAFT_356955 [Lineolata rhizophorae]|uniref:Retrovirus-related Pol polyprotein from transposon TNT 1-94-like beta-barrel domain-containing protein n=1 Tax=Lineolata rhizophorae TaxID=578093 RepID=A0A6A6NNC0_9PEZI|nr:hypothetical protein BDY21DRAFT_356955 [Lineolata rhizophorae]